MKYFYSESCNHASDRGRLDTIKKVRELVTTAVKWDRWSWKSQQGEVC
jgi:hypothetical protein